VNETRVAADTRGNGIRRPSPRDVPLNNGSRSLGKARSRGRCVLEPATWRCSSNRESLAATNRRQDERRLHGSQLRVRL